MSRVDARERITRAAIDLGSAEGVGALSLQAIAKLAGVSKALLLYHFAGKAALLGTVVAALGSDSETRLRRAATAPAAMVAWRSLAHEESASGQLALLGALTLEAELDAEPLREMRARRESAAAALATAVLAEVQLVPRVPSPLLGRLLLRQLDGVAVSASRDGLGDGALESELDAFALALLALGD